jgi:hypothetical protein
VNFTEAMKIRVRKLFEFNELGRGVIFAYVSPVVGGSTDEKGLHGRSFLRAEFSTVISFETVVGEGGFGVSVCAHCGCVG